MIPTRRARRNARVLQLDFLNLLDSAPVETTLVERMIARRYRLPLHQAALVAKLASLGGGNR